MMEQEGWSENGISFLSRHVTLIVIKECVLGEQGELQAGRWLWSSSIQMLLKGTADICAQKYIKKGKWKSMVTSKYFGGSWVALRCCSGAGGHKSDAFHLGGARCPWKRLVIVHRCFPNNPEPGQPTLISILLPSHCTGEFPVHSNIPLLLTLRSFRGSHAVPVS